MGGWVWVPGTGKLGLVRGPEYTQGLEEAISVDLLIILHDSWLDFYSTRDKEALIVVLLLIRTVWNML